MRIKIMELVLVVACVGLFATGSFAEQKGDAAAGKEKYNQICATCHGATGKGDGPGAAALEPKPRDLSDGEYVSTLTDEHIFKVIKEGGAAAGLSPMMPAWGGALSDEDVWNVVAFIRTDVCACEAKAE